MHDACMHAYARAANYSTPDNLVLLGRPLVLGRPRRLVVVPAAPPPAGSCSLDFGLGAAAPLLDLVNLYFPEINRSQKSLCEIPRSALSHLITMSITLPAGRPAGRPRDVAAAC